MVVDALPAVVFGVLGVIAAFFAAIFEAKLAPPSQTAQIVWLRHHVRRRNEHAVRGNAPEWAEHGDEMKCVPL
jgi:hypothetical protein